jgi:hypothetical protein
MDGSLISSLIKELLMGQHLDTSIQVYLKRTNRQMTNRQTYWTDRFAKSTQEEVGRVMETSKN